MRNIEKLFEKFVWAYKKKSVTTLQVLIELLIMDITCIIYDNLTKYKCIKCQTPVCNK